MDEFNGILKTLKASGQFEYPLDLNPQYTGEWWPSVFPGLALAVTVLGFSLLGEALVQITDPTRR